MLDCIKNFFKQKSFHEKMNKKHKEIMDYHLNPIEWNLQTSTYIMITRLFNELDDENIQIIADLYNKDNDIKFITKHLDLAIVDVLIGKKLIKES